MSHNNKNKIWRKLCDVIFPPKMPKSEKQKHVHFFWNGEFYIVAKFQVNCVKNKRMNKGRRFWCHICPPCWVCFCHAIGQFGALSLFTSEKKSLNKVIRRLWTLRAWMLTLSFNILKCVYLWTKAMKKLTHNLIDEDSSQRLKILS